MNIMTEEQKTTGWRLFLDDERQPTWDLDQPIVAIDCNEAQKFVQDFGVPELISFDHDLGKDHDGTVKPTAMAFLWWLIDEDLDGRLDLREVKRVIVHSRNTEGAKNIAGLWDGYAKDIGSDVRAEIRPRATLTK